ncbi:hypothetical protein BCR37DRAFT_378269 [Protomyces lactucae-debilis]|uniref:Cytidyltransferase-like domain-containing protein n=1 Tax=Protomyces lactucae-debilis TaxID=2754530 RepID=A0A1Y2FNH9_PROLT|nr:uncharacterized protein BCR37DRAFT_378269 [Protomyces lactucae-debilis]ORY84275.1 hypothetical protein BCR37DRAFT_378269 [Protomyces lactucae-debilis]
MAKQAVLYVVQLNDSLDASCHFDNLKAVICDLDQFASLDILICSQRLQGNQRRAYFIPVQKLISQLYLEAARLAELAGKELDTIVILQGYCGYAIEKEDCWTSVAAADAETLSNLPGLTAETKLYTPVTSSSEAMQPDQSEPQSFECVAVGGTFDHLHDGHKILLSMTAWLATVKVICGVTDDALLQKKKHKELLESIDARRKSVERFYYKFKRGLIYDLPAINDVYGPTGHVDAIDALVASKETEAGGKMIEEERARKALRRLEIFYIEVIGADGKVEGEAMQELKLSSTAIRERLARARKL